MQLPSVMIVTESEFLASHLAELLHVNDLRACCAGGPTEAADRYERFTPNVAVVDWDLPKRDAVLATIRRKSRGSGFSVFALARGDSARDAERHPDVVGVVDKPVETSTFIRTIAGEVRRRRVESEPLVPA